jgi:heme exporter protein C
LDPADQGIAMPDQLPVTPATTIRMPKDSNMTLIDLANPTRFLSLTARILPWLAAATAILLAIGLYQSVMAPDDYQQGATVKIMFIHVPNAWLSMFVWGVMSVAALGTLVWRHPLADVAAKAAAPIGAAFTFLALVTGSLWGRPMWGTYWEWDARLTSVLILFLMYLGLMALWRAVEDPSRAARAAAILTLVGAINLPIIKFSVDWWNTLHQPASVFRMGGPTLDRAFLMPLLVMAVAFSLLFITLHLAAMRNEILRRRVRLLIVWVAIDFRRQQQRLRELEQSGVSRRSGRAAADIK